MLKKFFMISKDVAKNIAKAAKESDTLKGIAKDAKRLLDIANKKSPVKIKIEIKKQK